MTPRRVAGLCAASVLLGLLVAGCGTVGLGISLPIGRMGGITVGGDSQGGVGVGVGVGGSRGGVSVGASGQLPAAASSPAAAAAASAASAPTR